jgi:predicted NBD/HSP70 family sugar kinase
MLLTPGALYGLIRQYPDGLAKSEVVALTGLSRTAVSQRIDALVAAGFLAPSTSPPTASRGRPAERYIVNSEQGVFLVADTGATGMRTAVCSPTGSVLAEQYEPIDTMDGPTVVLDLINARFKSLIAAGGITGEEVLGIGISVPGPVAYDSGRVVSPPIMAGWHEYDIPGRFAPHFSCPVIVENDANAMVYGEHRMVSPDVNDLVFIKMGTGIGVGLMLGGQLQRGADGAAGDMGHTSVAVSDEGTPPLCRCGNVGCLEAYAGGWAILRDLTAAGIDVPSIDDLVLAVRGGNRTALQLVRAAATTVAAAVAHLVNIVNPRVVVFGGQLAGLDEIILATVREVIYRHSHPLATRKLVITTSGVDDPGVLGLASLIADHVFAPDHIDQAINARP